MNNTIVIAAAIVAAALIVKLPIGSTPGRYQIAGSAGSHFRLDTATGNAWSIAPGGTGLRWVAFADNGARP
jgi:hypothetical protein